MNLTEENVDIALLVINQSEEFISELIATLQEIRDLARTGTAPTSFNMTLEEWNKYKLNKCATLADTIIKEWESYE